MPHIFVHRSRQLLGFILVIIAFEEHLDIPPRMGLQSFSIYAINGLDDKSTMTYISCLMIALIPTAVNRFSWQPLKIFGKELCVVPEWTFLTKHALVLSLIAKQPRITAQELAAAIGTTERQIRRVIADLFTAGYINKKREGRGLRYRINLELSLRHDTHWEIAIGDFLEALGWRRRHRKTATTKLKGKHSQLEA
jgi:DNA-binding transcriptional ArsR family regulator